MWERYFELITAAHYQRDGDGARNNFMASDNLQCRLVQSSNFQSDASAWLGKCFLAFLGANEDRFVFWSTVNMRIFIVEVEGKEYLPFLLVGTTRTI